MAFPFGSMGTLVAGVPILLQFHPENSLVFVVLAGGSAALRVTARLDLPTGVVECDRADEDWWPRIENLVENAIHPGDLVHVLVYSEGSASLAIAESDRISTVVTSSGARIGEALWVRGDTWMCMACAQVAHLHNDHELAAMSATTCSPRGWQIQEYEELRARALAGVAHDRPIRRSRADLEEELQTRRPMLRMKSNVMNPQVREIAVAHAMEHLTSTTPEPMARKDQELLVSSIVDVRVRDTLVWDLVNGGPQAWRLATGRLTTLVVHTRGEARAATAVVLAIMHWQLGDGARAHIALDAALSANPEYRLAHLLQAAVDSGLPPKCWRDGLVKLDRSVCLGEADSAA
jgi:hypothetical protein